MCPTRPDDLPRFAELEQAYALERELGRGGTAVVYLARELELDRHVAIKVIRSTYLEDGEAAARLLREARMVGGLQHPNIVALYGTRRLGDGSLALIMQYVPGVTLRSEIRRRGPLPFDEATRILTDVAGALAHAHRRRIVHRDIKPHNIYLDEDAGIARLSDFGIARPWGADSGLTLPGHALGTPAYMSPEQIDGGSVDGRSDLYSLGLVGYEMLTGRPPWAGENLYSTIFRQKNDELPSVDALRPGVPPGLLNALQGALSKQPDDRWPDAEHFLAALNDETAPPVARRSGGVLHSTPTGALPDTGALPPADGPPTEDAGLDDLPTLRYRRPAQGGSGPPREVAPAGRPPAPVPAAPPLPQPSALRPEREPAVPAPMPRQSVPVRHRADPGIVRAPRRRRRAILATLLLVLVAGGVAVAALLRDGDESVPRGEPVLLEQAPAPPAGGSDVGAPVVAYAFAGAEQEGIAGEMLADWLILRVEDGAGRPVANAAVHFAITAGVGALRPAEAVTNEFGMAAARWLVESAGDHTAEARLAGGSVAPTVFRARVRAAGADFPAAALGEAATPTGPATAGDPTIPAAPAIGPASVLPVRPGVAAGGMHSCLLDEAGSVVCWGGNGSGQLGDGSQTRRGAPVPVVAPEPFARLGLGVTHSCAVAASGAAYCWGANAAGQLGDGGRTASSQPVRVRTDERLGAVGAGASHTCGLTMVGRALCWGENGGGQVGDGTRASRTVPVPVAGSWRFAALAVGWEHSCGLTTEGRAACWGHNASGELGDGSTTDRLAPVAVAAGHRFAALAAGSGFTCGLRSDGIVLCWGRNSHGQLGRADVVTMPAPMEVATAERFSRLVAGAVHVCALTRAGSAFCWGRNHHGQLGDDTTDDRPTPGPVQGNRVFGSLSALGSHTCGTGASGTFCWGYNLEGQLGNGTRSNVTRPAAVSRQ